MNDFTNAKIEIFIPETHLDGLREALHQAGAGVIGNYDHCLSFSSVRGSWRPLYGSTPYLGEAGKIFEGSELKVEVNCKREMIPEVLKAIRAVHPYEEPVINIIPLANHLFE